tara:strand:+ start:24 stop:503 length:480 start_codon:yes stop_codon:yes gene_type:complete
MGVLANHRHERFAQNLAKGQSASKAYVNAGYKGDRTAASRLSTKDNICHRVEEIQSRVADKAEWSAAERLLALKQIYDRDSGKDSRVGISAIAEANKMQGSYAPSKHEHKGKFTLVTITPDHLNRLSSDELSALEAAYPVLRKLGLVGSDGGSTQEEGD